LVEARHCQHVAFFKRRRDAIERGQSSRRLPFFSERPSPLRRGFPFRRKAFRRSATGRMLHLGTGRMMRFLRFGRGTAVLHLAGNTVKAFPATNVVVGARKSLGCIRIAHRRIELRGRHTRHATNKGRTQKGHSDESGHRPTPSKLSSDWRNNDPSVKVILIWCASGFLTI
jgi:hypothetical protein